VKYTNHSVSRFLCSIGAMFALAFAVGVANAETPSVIDYTLIADFTGSNGDYPGGNLVADGAGNFYGVTSWGGHVTSSGTCVAPYGCGVVYEASPSSSGWKLTVIFKFSGNDGAVPGGGLMMDKSGNLYGAASFGGNGVCQGQTCGLIYELSPHPGGRWTERVLYEFQGAPDGETPTGTLALDLNGNLYGVTTNGGSGSGVAFELSPTSGAEWTEKTILAFTGADEAGMPEFGLISDKAGNLYGVSNGGDENGVCGSESIGCGMVYELSLNDSGQWMETVLFSFDGTNGFRPTGNLIFDAAGNLYGTTADGGDLSGCNFGGGCGLVYELLPGGDGNWTENVLHAFLPGADGNSPFAGVTVDSSGNLYGTTLHGGAANNGVVFKLAKRSSGTWPETLLHSFTGGTDGGQPESQLLMDSSGMLLGTAVAGGLVHDCTATHFAGCGVVFEISK
jgi:uncharacterized repeat protein (TIGR03803 family)